MSATPNPLPLTDELEQVHSLVFDLQHMSVLMAELAETVGGNPFSVSAPGVSALFRAQEERCERALRLLSVASLRAMQLENRART